MRITGPTLRLPWWLVILGLFGRVVAWLLLRAVLLVKRHPNLSTGTAATAGLWHLWQTVPVSYPATGAVLAITSVWSLCWPQSFDACLGNRLRARWRRLVYRRHWQPACNLAGLCTDTPQGQLPPRLLRVRSPRPDLDILTAEADPPTPDAWRKAAHELARILSVHTIRVRPGRRGRVELYAYRADPLLEPVPPLIPAKAVNLEAVPVGIREDGQPFTLPLIGSHTLIAGATGAGKGSILWSLIAGVGPLIHTGLVRLWVIDAKRGVELSPGRPLFQEFTYGGPVNHQQPWQTEFAELLEDAATSMQRRLDAMRDPAHPDREPTRKHVPVPGEPLIVIVIDELAALLALVTDTALRRRITDALTLILTQGRAAAVAVIGATQDARQETLAGTRPYWPTRVLLRVPEANQVGMVLGPGMRERGAYADQIPHHTPGVGYVALEDAADPVRVRFSHYDDAAVADLVTRYAPTRMETAA